MSEATRAGAGGLPMVALRSTDGAIAHVYLHGAHVTSWKPARDGDERLFLSERSEFRPGVAIRGGIPVIFPQFAAEGPLPRHGFARTSEWMLDSVSTKGGDAIASLSLRDSADTRAIWNHEFLATLGVRVGGDQLVVTLTVENCGTAPLSFTAALHSYLRVFDARDTTLVGLRGTKHRESGEPGTLVKETGDALRFDGKVDRVYVDVPRTLTLWEPERSLEIGFDTFPDAVVWNPGPAKAAALADMEPGGERHMACVEAAVVQRPVTLGAGEQWSGTQRFRAG
ncbi:MAG TPA: D-hexose-6-phosphate mutarotase [Gemmatimonadaceae bacterium]